MSVLRTEAEKIDFLVFMCFFFIFKLFKIIFQFIKTLMCFIETSEFYRDSTAVN